jgi:NitT/TauT family transport system substrate-binding protein
MRTKQVDGLTIGIDVAYQLEKEGQGKLLASYGDYVKVYLTHAIYASDMLIAKRPEALRRFLTAWFETIEWMQANKDQTVKIHMVDDGVTDPNIAARTYDKDMPMFSHDGHFDPAALTIVRKAMVELELLPTEPDMTKLYTEAFLPSGTH